MFRSLLTALEELTLLVLPHGGQRTARHNAWRAATDLHVTTGYRWVDQISVSAFGLVPAPANASVPSPAVPPATTAHAGIPAEARAGAPLVTRPVAAAAGGDFPAPRERESAPRPAAARAPGTRGSTGRAPKPRVSPPRARAAAAARS
ncbi:hypothetical protein Ga0074812_13552 [Parafrankia irregularis]|uniref:Uncharacterized protein n=1 Tax=Parafrankia irregularis TaxID=795642 RepID=A0A0S4QYD6_9ACTN|nr:MULTISPECIES: hypothetical protein [Parafrankia]MBE3206325.1 hypothetical protein [Parafrankia sp. CH37]CUU60110.1 hypothetical protein Ga0074812_13552 [Parafrankia irregularis]